MHTDVCGGSGRRLKEIVSWLFLTITWSEVGKNNVQAKKFYSSGILYLLPHLYFIFLSNLWVFSRLLCQGVCSLILHFTLITFQLTKRREKIRSMKISFGSLGAVTKIFHLRYGKRATKKMQLILQHCSKKI